MREREREREKGRRERGTERLEEKGIEEKKEKDFSCANCFLGAQKRYLLPISTVSVPTANQSMLLHFLEWHCLHTSHTSLADAHCILPFSSTSPSPSPPSPPSFPLLPSLPPGVPSTPALGACTVYQALLGTLLGPQRFAHSDT
jgi:hypothetical protein